MRRGSVAIALLALSACRMDVQLDTRRDAAPSLIDARVIDASRAPDAFARDAFVPDADLDALHLDAPPPPLCAGPALTLGAVTASSAASSPMLSMIGSGADRRYAVLVPPSARALPVTTARLVLLDVRATVLFDRELDSTGGAALIAVPDASTLDGEPAYAVILGDQLSFLDARGESVGDAIALPRSIDPAHQSSLGWVDDTHLVYVGSDLSLVSVDRGAGVATAPGAIVLAGDRVMIAEGSVVLNRGEPTLETIELATTLDGTETLHLSFPTSPMAGHVLAAFRIGGERRWIAKTDGEFRTQPRVHRVRDDGSNEPLSGDIVVLGPPDATQRDGIAAIGGSDGTVLIVDPEVPSVRTLVTAGAHSLAAIARGPDGVAALVVEPGDPDARLVLRCEI